MSKPRVCIVVPALASANNGNWHTAARWQRFLAPLANTELIQAWHDEPAHALIALHARRSADSIARFHATHADAPLALVLTGTDLYRDLQADASARRSVQSATHLVVLQPEGLAQLDAAARAKARVINQSATRLVRRDQARATTDFVAVGHLREEKDPLTLLRAVARLFAPRRAAARPLPALRVLHIGGALDAALGQAAERCMVDCPHYRWLGGQPRNVARRWIARSHALVHPSRIEGGAHVVIEAVRSRVPVLASRIDGNVGLLGTSYDGYFPVGDDAALAALMQRFANDAAFAAHLAAQCLLREPAFAPAVEAAQVRRLLAAMLNQRAAAVHSELLPQ